MSYLGISVVAGLATVGILVGRAGLWRRGLLGPASCGGCRPTAVWQDLPVGPGGPRSWHQPAGGRWGQVQGQSMLVGREAPCVNGLKGGFQNATCIQSINIFFVEQASKNGSHQHLWSCGGIPVVSCLFRRLSRSANGSDPESFQLTAFALRLEACEILLVPFKSRVYVFPSSPVSKPH